MKIAELKVEIIQSSLGQPTIQVSLTPDQSQIASASVPAGVSTGANEAFVLDPKLASQKLDSIKTALLSHDFLSLGEFDQRLNSLDGTANKSNLGGNLILAMSIAFTKAWAAQQDLEVYQLISQLLEIKPSLPRCFFNLIEGGKHVDASPKLPFQEYLLVPQTHSAQQSLDEAQKVVSNLRLILGSEIKSGYEGGFEIQDSNPETGLKILSQAIFQSGIEADLSLDIAASTFYQDGVYKLADKLVNRLELLNDYRYLVSTYQLLSIEDPFSQDDRQGFSEISSALQGKIWIIGDDLTTTHPQIIEDCAQKKLINGVIIKPNQIGSVSETLEAVKVAKRLGLKIIVSHRGEETADDFIADLAMGVAADGLKAGAPTQPVRLVKYRRLIEIEHQLRV